MQLAPDHIHHCITCHQPNWWFNADANMGHAFGIFMAHVGTLHSLRSFRRRLPWALGILARMCHSNVSTKESQ